MSKISVTGTSRIRSTYVKRNQNVSISKVASLEKVHPVINDTLSSSLNTLIDYQRFYDTLVKTKRAFKESNEKFEETEEERELSIEDLFLKINSMVSQYNLALSNLYTLERKYGGTNAKDILGILHRAKDTLQAVGIDVDEVGYMKIKASDLLPIIRHSIGKLFFIFNPNVGLLDRLYEKFRSIRMDTRDRNFIHGDSVRMRGNIIDTKG